VNIDKKVALQRLKKRNEQLLLLGGVRKDKAEDKFVTEEFDKRSDLYENEMIPQLDKLGLKHETVDNSGTIEETIKKILEKL
jgi:adenylate kinase family enzyme